MTTDYKTRLKQAIAAWLNSDPSNKEETSQAWRNYQVAWANYQNVKGV